jgi:hypothetical protein
MANAATNIDRKDLVYAHAGRVLRPGGRFAAYDGFEILEEIDSTDQSIAWFKEITARMATAGVQPLSIGILLGPDYPQMAQNHLRNLAERRIRTVSFICKA